MLRRQVALTGSPALIRCSYYDPRLGVLLWHGDPGRARRWWEKAAEAGHASVMNNLGVLVWDSDPGLARHWWEEAAEAGHAGAMYNLGVLLKDSDPGQAR